MQKMPGAKVLVFNPPSEGGKTEKLFGLLRTAGVRYRIVAPEEGGQSVGFLLGLDGFLEQSAAEETQGAAGTSALIFYNFSKAGLDQFLAALKRAGIFIPLKAVVTEHNKDWSMNRLTAELEQEHSLMKSWQRLSALCKQYKGSDRDLVREAKALLSSHAPQKQELEAMIRRFTEQD